MNETEEKSILIAEDDAILRRMFVIALEASGYRVREAGDGQEAQELFKAEPPDILVSDLHMPIMDGLRLVEWVRKELNSKIPILVLTSLGNQEAGQQALTFGANRVGRKPMQLDELLSEIELLLT
jgi:CheY-like chemotaxis protein